MIELKPASPHKEYFAPAVRIVVTEPLSVIASSHGDDELVESFNELPEQSWD